MENELGSRLLKLMTAVNYGLKHYVNEFIYVLCAEDGTLHHHLSWQRTTLFTRHTRHTRHT
jgi:hypothetical protein